MSRRVWIWIAAIVLPIVFVAGVLVGRGSQAPSADPPATTSGRPGSTTTEGATVVTATTTVSSMPGKGSGSVGETATTVLADLPSGWSVATVVDVIDGDTIDVLTDEGSVERLRLIGTNAPELGECYAAEATDGLSALILGETVYLEPDTSERDQFGRLLRYVWTVDHHNVNEASVENGWAIARAYPPDTSRAGELEAAQDRAMDAEIGLWARDACGGSVPPDIQVGDVEYDAAGDDNFNLNGEWVQIVNGDDVVVDMTGWVIKDESATHRYPFPTGFTLDPGASVTVFTGCGDDGIGELFWCETGSAVWNNEGDTVFLLDPQGTIVFSYAYG